MRELALVHQLDIAARVDRARPSDIEDGSEGSRRNGLLARSKYPVQREAAPRSAGEKLVQFLAVRVHRNTLIRGGGIKLLKEKLILPLGIVEGSGKKQFQAVAELVAIADAALVGLVAGYLARHNH